MAQLSSFPTTSFAARGPAAWPPNLRPLSYRIRLKPSAGPTSMRRGAAIGAGKTAAAPSTREAIKMVRRPEDKPFPAPAGPRYSSDRLETALWVTLAFISFGLLALSFG